MQDIQRSWLLTWSNVRVKEHFDLRHGYVWHKNFFQLSSVWKSAWSAFKILLENGRG